MCKRMINVYMFMSPLEILFSVFGCLAGRGGKWGKPQNFPIFLSALAKRRLSYPKTEQIDDFIPLCDEWW